MAEHILGIDFGTTNSVMAAIDKKTGQPQVIPNAEGEEKTPSIVYYAPEGVLVGRGAESALADAEFLEDGERDIVLQSIFRSIKRELGKQQMHALPDGKTVTPVEIASEVFKKLKKDAEELYFHEPITQAVVTHPAAFSPSQRNAVEEAAHRAGFTQVSLLEEPVAAALGQMARGEKVGQGMLVYDLGGGTFDLAYVQREGEIGFRTPLGPLGLARCGGDDVDQKIYDYLDEQAREKDLSLYHRDGNLSQATLLECRKGKEDLSSRTQTRITVMIPEVHAAPKHYFLKREELEGLMEELAGGTVKQTLELKRRVEQENLPLDQVVLIGGSTRSPLIQRKLEEALGGSLPVMKTVYADYAVALGAALGGKRSDAQPVSGPVATGKTSPVAGSKEGVRYVNDHHFTILGRLTGSENDWEELKEAEGAVFLPENWVFGIKLIVSSDAEFVEAVQSIADINEWIVSRLDLSECRQITDRELATLDILAQLANLNLYYSEQITDRGLARLKGLTHLSNLYIHCYNKITDNKLALLEGLTQLVSLDLSFCKQITDWGLASLKGLIHLANLNLTHCDQITDRGLASLKGLTDLASLDISYCKQITDRGLTSLRGLTQLASVNLSFCRITDHGLASLEGLTQLANLNLTHCDQITDAGIAYLQGGDRLHNLNLSGCIKLTDQCLEILQSLPELSFLKLEGCSNISDKSIQKFRQSNPRLKIYH